jgi:hypothetical protein
MDVAWPRYSRMGGGCVAYFKGQAFVKQGCEEKGWGRGIQWLRLTAAAGKGHMFCKGGPGKNHQARLPGGLVGLEGLSLILSCMEPWNTVYTHQGPTSPPWDVPMERFNSSRVPHNIRLLEHLSLYGLHQRSESIARFGSAEFGRIFLVQIFSVVG